MPAIEDLLRAYMREPVVIEYVLEAGREIPPSFLGNHNLDMGFHEILSSNGPGEPGTCRVARISVEGVGVRVHYSRAIDTMFQTLSNVQTGEAVPLLEPIDNRCGKLQVGLRSITYTVGWYNVEPGEQFSWQEVGGMTSHTNTVPIPPGLYGVERLMEFIEESTNTVGITLSVSKENGLINLTVGGNSEVLFTDGLLRLLGLDDGLGGQWLGAGIYTGDRPVNFAKSRELRLHLEQLNSTDNTVDGAPSTLLTSIGIRCHAFGDIETVRITHPEFKQLQAGSISELKVVVRGNNGEFLDNHSLSITVTLEIQQL